MDVETIPGLPVLPAVVIVDFGTWVVGVGPSTVQVYLSIIEQHIHSRQLHTVLNCTCVEQLHCWLGSTYVRHYCSVYNMV